MNHSYKPELYDKTEMEKKYLAQKKTPHRTINRSKTCQMPNEASQLVVLPQLSRYLVLASTFGTPTILHINADGAIPFQVWLLHLLFADPDTPDMKPYLGALELVRIAP